MIYPAWVVARALVRGVDTRSAAGIAALALVAAMVMTAWDTVMDPGMAAAGNWVWEKGGPYFGVPLRNYFGWLLTTFLVYCGAGLIWRGKRAAAGVPSGFAALPVVVYAVDALQYVTAARFPALHVVALFSMGMPGLLALVQVFLARKESWR
jgi:putative membrane protein